MRLGSSVALAPMRRRDFALLWTGSMVSNVGSWMQTVAVGALVTASTGEATWAVLVAAGAFLPIGLLSPIGGALADRLERRRWLIIGNVVQTALAAVLALLVYAGDTSPGLLTLVVTGQGCISALVFPFQQAILPDLVPRQELLAAASLNSAQFNLGRVIGPALAGLTVAAFGYGTAFVANAASFLAVVLALAFVHLPAPPGAGTASLWENIKAGARAARDEPGCRAAIGLIAVTALLASPFIALIPAVAHSLTNGTSRAVGSATAALTTAQGVGAVLGALTVASLALRVGRARLLIAEMVAVGVALIAYDLSPSIPVAVITLTIVGALYIGVLSGLTTVVQLQAPDAYRGRVLSLFNVALGVVYPIGALAQGPIADAVGLPLTTVVSACLLLVVLGVVGLVRPTVYAALAADRATLTPATLPIVS
jgi:MFS family permease